jgi:hypothetical protein
MAGLEGALKFYITERHGVPVILVPGVAGMPEVAASPHPLLRVSYMSPEEAASEDGIQY